MADMQKAIAELQDTMTVVVEIQSRQASALKDAAEWLTVHEDRLQKTELNLLEASEKLNALIDIVKGGLA